MYHKFNTNLIMIAPYHINSFVNLSEPFVSPGDKINSINHKPAFRESRGSRSAAQGNIKENIYVY
jgi:hypothetical protein